MRLNHDFPEVDPALARYDLPDPYSDIAIALESGSYSGLIKSNERLTLTDLAEVVEYSITSNSGEWTGEGGAIGTELSMVLVGRLADGRWFGLEAWNDYTGWGCQDSSDIYVGPTLTDVSINGLTNDGRSALDRKLDVN